jgi:GT2 family glycosyltransferase
MNERIAAVISTYNRKELLRSCIKSLLTQIRPPDAIIVVDGPSTDGTREMINKEFPQVSYIRIHEDIGGAGQFYIGIKIAYKKGYDWVWLMDDDVEVVKREGLKTLLKIAHELRSAGIPIGALIPLQLVRGRLVQVGPLSIFVGGLISRDAISKAGFPRHDFFIYYDDVEYAFRIICAGFAVKYGPPILEHRGWPRRKHLSIRMKGKEHRLPILSGKRMYYLVRNGIIFAKNYSQFTLLLRIIMGSIVRALQYVVILRRYEMPCYIARGIIEGFLNMTGNRFSNIKL